MSILNHTFPPDLEKIYNANFANQLAKTQAAIVTLNQARNLLHNPTLLMKPILVKEAEASSRLEGTQATIEDVYKNDIEDQSINKKEDVLEIRNYERAMLRGIDLVRNTKKLNNFVIREIHKVLLNGVRGEKKNPGKFRENPVWIGEDGTGVEKARYIAPEHIHIQSLMELLESYVNLSTEIDINPLIACGVLHHRFEAIHPFQDGNGRTGRLLISLYLIHRGILTEPMLYASGYFESNKSEYINQLSKVDKNEDWQSWLLYFLIGLEKQANKSMELALAINTLFKNAELRIQKTKYKIALIQALEYCFVKPIITAPILERATGITVSSSKRYLSKLCEEEIIRDVGIIKNQRVYINTKLIDTLKNI